MKEELLKMDGLRGWIFFGWIALPTVMFTGVSTLTYDDQR
jgi:hypothetical protein